MALLAGCSDIPHAWSENDIREIAEDAAEDTAEDASPDVSELTAKVAELEKEVARLRQEQNVDVDMFARMSKANVADEKYNSAEIARLTKNERNLLNQVNWLLQRNGAPVIPIGE